MASESEQWKEIVDLKVTCPRILCIVPAVVQDVLASALMAIGARPIFPEGKYAYVACQYASVLMITECPSYLPTEFVNRTS
jgi:hydroxyethylthiazole kinase-like sugar kinase family protein